MSRSLRHAALGALVALISCSVYDKSLLVGGPVDSGAAAQGDGGTSGAGGNGGRGATSGTGGALGGSDQNGGSSQKGGSSQSGGSSQNGGSSQKGGTSNGTGGSSGGSGGSNGGSDTSPGGTDDGGNVGEGGAAADGGTAGTGGLGGTSGSGGAAGGAMGGSAGSAAGTGGSTSGNGGTGGMVTASGCAVMSAGLAAATDNTHYLITLGSTDVDFTDALVDVHLYAQGTGGGIFLYVQEATYEFYGQPAITQFAAFDGWTTLHWDLSSETSTGTLDKAKVRRLGFEITGAGASAWTNPMIVYVDAITVTTPTLSFTFDATTSVHTTPTSYYATDTALWLNNSSSDTTATGSTVAWATSCP